MASFRYRAIDRQQRVQRGVLEAGDARQVRQQLRERGWQVVQVRPASATWFARFARQQRLGAMPRALLTRQLATLLHAGMPLAEALQALAEQSTQRQQRLVLRGVADGVAEGNALATAMARYPGAFPVVYRATVAAAERSGDLAAVFERLAAHGEQQQATRQKVQLAMVYPLILLGVSLLVVGFLLGFVVPDVVQAFARDQASLPTPTKVLIVLSEGVRRHGVVAVLLLGGGTLLLSGLLRKPARRRQWHALVLRLPLYGDFVRARDAARFASTLAILGRSGVALVEALQIGASVVGNVLLRERLQRAADELAEGASLASSLGRSAALPALMLHMIASGERAGELDSMLERAADLQEKHLGTRVALLMSLCEPLMLLVMGGIVLFIVLAILLPILNLNQLVN